MARVTLRNDETESGMLPEVCMHCGKPSDIEKHIVYEWHPFWINFLAVLLCFGGVIYLVLFVLCHRTRAVYVPLCRKDNHHGEMLLSVVLLAFGVAIATIFGLLDVYGSNQLWTVFVVGCCVFALLVVYLVRQALFLRVVRITDEDITLQNVHPNFVAALEEDRKYDWYVVE